jgi:hypothetical protein
MHLFYLVSIPVYKENPCLSTSDFLKFTLDIRVLKYGNGRGNTRISVAGLRVNVKGNGHKYVGYEILITVTTNTGMQHRVER